MLDGSREHEEKFGKLGSAVGFAPLPQFMLQSFETAEKQTEALLHAAQSMQLSVVKSYFTHLRTFLAMGRGSQQ